jgi:long-chain fatty acid transport protein
MGGSKLWLCIVVLLGGMLGSVVGSSAFADQFHYRNFIMGDRAVGLGGAYAGVSDDASGVIYNPAGLAFALSNDISGSANAFYSRTITYKNALGSEDFVEKSTGSLPAFFGILQKMESTLPGLVVAFGSYTTDSDLKDQDDLIEGLEIGGTELNRLHRTANIRANTQFYGLGAGYRISSSFSVGFGINYFQVDELVQEYQDSIQSTGDANIKWRLQSQNRRERLEIFGMMPVLGVQWAFGGQFSLGLTIKQGVIISEKMEKSFEIRKSLVATDADLASVETKFTSSVTNQSLTVSKVDAPLKKWPGEARIGFAWFANTRLLWTTDIIHYTEAKGGDLAIYDREAVTNFATGVEYYVLPAFPLRFGLFTNNDARPEVQEGKENQSDHIDYIGESLFIAWVQPNSQIALGAVLQQGEGKAQKIGGSTIQEVEASSRTFAFSATHNF